MLFIYAFVKLFFQCFKSLLVEGNLVSGCLIILQKGLFIISHIVLAMLQRLRTQAAIFYGSSTVIREWNQREIILLLARCLPHDIATIDTNYQFYTQDSPRNTNLFLRVAEEMSLILVDYEQEYQQLQSFIRQITSPVPQPILAKRKPKPYEEEIDDECGELKESDDHVKNLCYSQEKTTRGRKSQNEREYETVVPRLNLWREEPIGYTQVLLSLTSFLNENADIDSTWERLISVVGRFDLSFDKIMEMAMESLCNSRSSSRIIALLSKFDLKKLITVLITKICPEKQQSTELLVNIGPLISVVEFSMEDLHCKRSFPYSPRYLKLLRQLIIGHFLKFEQISHSFRYLTTEDLDLIQINKLETQAARLSAISSMNLSQQRKQRKNEEIWLNGQALYCIRLALQVEHIRCNDWPSCLQMGVPNDLSIHVLILRQLAQALEWRIRLLYNSIIPGRLSLHYRTKEYSMPVGYWLQLEHLNEEFLTAVQQIIPHMSIYIGLFPKLFVQLCRLIAKLLDEYPQFEQRAAEIIISYLLGGLTFQENAAFMSSQLYRLLSRYSQQKRFEIYMRHRNEVFMNNPHLVMQIELACRKQAMLFNRISNNNQFSTHRALVKLQSNKCMQTSWDSLRTILLPSFQVKLDIILNCMAQAPQIGKQLTLCMSLQRVLSIKPEQISVSGLPPAIYRGLSVFIAKLASTCPKLQLIALIDLIFKFLSDPLPTRPEQQLGWLTVLKALMQTVFPDHSQLGSRQNFTSYYLQLETKQQIPAFLKTAKLREQLWQLLTRRQPNKRILLVEFVQLLQQRISGIISEKLSLQLTGILIDTYTKMSHHLMAFFSFMINELRRKAELSCYSVEDYSRYFNAEDFYTLLAERMPISLVATLLRSVSTIQIYERSGKVQQIWKNATQNLQQQQITHISYSSKKIRQFMNSEFVFNFWFCESSHILPQQQAYTKHLSIIRNKLTNTSPFAQVTAYKLIQAQKNRIAFDYQRFHFNSHNIMLIDYMKRPEKSTRFRLPYPSKSKSDYIRQLADLLAMKCLLPRLLMSSKDSLLCAQFVFRTIKQNSIPSNRALLLIFYVIEAIISYLPCSTQRQASTCLPLFVNTLLTPIKHWQNFRRLEADLTKAIQLQKFNEQRHSALKNFIINFISRITTRLLCPTQSPYQINNCLHFMDKCQMLPLSLIQKQDILALLRNISQNKENPALASRVRRFASELDIRTQFEPQPQSVNPSTAAQKVQLKKPQTIIIDLQATGPPPKKRKQYEDGY